jgi:hypothetical protein
MTSYFAANALWRLRLRATRADSERGTSADIRPQSSWLQNIR